MAVRGSATEGNAFYQLLQATQPKASKPTFVEIRRGTMKRKRNASANAEDETASGDVDASQESGSVTNYRTQTNRTSRSRDRLKGPKEEVDERLGCTLFVGNVPLTMTRKRLKVLFSAHGTVQSIRFRSVVGERVGGSKRPLLDRATRFNVYVVFTDANAAEAGLKLNGHVVDGHHLRVDMAGNSRQHSHGKSVFVGNIPHEVTDDEVHAVFTDFGEIDGVRLVRDKFTGLCKGFGFVLFKDPASVLLATKFKGIQLKGRKLRVFRSRPMTNRHQPLQYKKLPHFAGEVAEGKKGKKKSFQRKKGIGQVGKKERTGVKRKAYSESTKLKASMAVGHKFQKKKLKIA